MLLWEPEPSPLGRLQLPLSFKKNTGRRHTAHAQRLILRKSDLVILFCLGESAIEARQQDPVSHLHTDWDGGSDNEADHEGAYGCDDDKGEAHDKAHPRPEPEWLQLAHAISSLTRRGRGSRRRQTLQCNGLRQARHLKITDDTEEL